MSRRIAQLRAALVVGVAALCGLAYVTLLPGQSVPDDPSFQSVIQPFLAKNCVACHNAKVATSGLNLQAFTDLATAKKQPEVWSRVFTKLSMGQMPPAGIPAPAKDQVSAVTSWITGTFGSAVASVAAPSAAPAGDAGRVTLRRLNRVEYNNTIRDLLGLNTKAAEQFPLDDSGYGFDNNGDVLSLSPLLMEKYIAAATKISRLAVYGPALPKGPGILVSFRAASLPSTGAKPTSLTFTVLPYSMRGALYGTYDFPKDGEYEFQFTPGDARGIDKPYQPPPLVSQGGAAGAAPSAASAPLPFPPQQAAAGGGGGGAAPANNAKAPRRQLTPDEIKVRDAKLVVDYPSAKWVFELDGKPVMEGSHAGGYTIDQGARPLSRLRQKLTAGEHSFRISYPALADVADPRDNIIVSRKSRALQVGRMEILGPFDPAPAPAASYKTIFICGEHDTACARKIVENLATRAYRRAATAAEVDRLMGMVNLMERQGKPFEEGIRLAVQTVLLSPDFLFRIETDPKVAPAPTAKPATGAPQGVPAAQLTPAANPEPRAAPVPRAYPVSDYEMASRLSYFLWSSMPDDELLLAAKEQRLRKPGVLEAEVKRMLADPKSEALAENFGGQWLGLRELSRRRPDVELFPTVDDDLLLFMLRETNLFFGAMLRENRSILDFIDAPFTYLNGPLARHYGIPGVNGYDFQRVDLKTDQRSGILTQASVMTVSSFPTRTSVVTRGKWVLENILGTPPPPPPPDAPSLNENDIGIAVTLRERMEQHRADPSCAACHSRMDPIGFSLENYDASGAWRTADGKFPIDNSGTLGDGKSFKGAQELKEILKSQPDLFTKNLSEKMLIYALGRGLETYDAAAVDGIVQRVKADHNRIVTLIQAVVASKPFQMRDGEIQ